MKLTYLTMTLAAVCVLAKASAADTATPSDTTATVTPSFTWAGVKGNESKFREDTGIKDGWTGGIQDFNMSSKLDKETSLNIEGRGLFDAHDYKLQLEIIKPEVYFVRAGFSEWRKYYNDMGGAYTFTNHLGTIYNPQNQDLHIDIRKIFFETGLIMPNLPKLTFGYERQEKVGMKSMLEWGTDIYTNTVNGTTLNGTSGIKIYPSFKAIDERTDIIRLGMEHDIKKIHFGDDFRYEHFQAADAQYDVSSYYLPPYSAGNAVSSLNKTNSAQTYYESYKNDLLSNTFHMDSQVNEKFYWSMGYMFNKFTGNDGNQDIVNTIPNTAAMMAAGNQRGDAQYYTTAVNLESESHVLNANFMYEPCKNVILNVGLQGEATDDSGFSTGARATITNSVAPVFIYGTESDKRSLNETFGIRYVGLPFTTLYAEGNLVQEQTYYKWQLAGDNYSVTNMINQLNEQRQAVKVGFNSSPINRVTLSAYYRRAIEEQDYDYGTPQQNLFLAQRMVTDEFVGKLTLRPNPRVMVALQYRWAMTDTTLDSVTQVSPGSSGHYDSSTYTLSTTITPIDRLYVTGLVSYQDTITYCNVNGAPYIAPYRGNVYTALASIGYAIDKKTDVTVEYSFSYQDNFNSNLLFNGGWSYGTDDRSNIIKVGLKRQIAKNVTANVRYEYYENVESSTAGINNYRANIVTTSCTIRF